MIPSVVKPDADHRGFSCKTLFPEITQYNCQSCDCEFKAALLQRITGVTREMENWVISLYEQEPQLLYLVNLI